MAKIVLKNNMSFDELANTGAYAMAGKHAAFKGHTNFEANHFMESNSHYIISGSVQNHNGTKTRRTFSLNKRGGHTTINPNMNQVGDITRSYFNTPDYTTNDKGETTSIGNSWKSQDTFKQNTFKFGVKNEKGEIEHNEMKIYNDTKNDKFYSSNKETGEFEEFGQKMDNTTKTNFTNAFNNGNKNTEPGLTDQTKEYGNFEGPANTITNAKPTFGEKASNVINSEKFQVGKAIFKQAAFTVAGQYANAGLLAAIFGGGK